MSTFLYELPTTGAISFADICTDLTADRAYTSHLAETTQSRANLRGVLKETKRTDGEKDYLRIVKVCCSSLLVAASYLLQILDEYIPQLRSLVDCVAHDEIGLQSEPSMSP